MTRSIVLPGRIATPRIAFLASRRAGSLTGPVFRADGGLIQSI